MFLYQLKEPKKAAVLQTFDQIALEKISPYVISADQKTEQMVILYSYETDAFWMLSVPLFLNKEFEQSEMILHIGSFWDVMRRTYLCPQSGLVLKKTGAKAYIFHLDRFFEQHRYTAVNIILWDSEELDHLLMKYDRDVVRVSFAVQYLRYPQIEKLYKAGFENIIHNFVLRDSYPADLLNQFEECFADTSKISTITSLSKGQWSEMIRYKLDLREWLWLKRTLNTYKIKDASLPALIRMTIRGGERFRKDFSNVCRCTQDGRPLYEADQLIQDLENDHGHTGLPPQEACTYLYDYIRLCRRHGIIPACRSTDLRQEHDTILAMARERKHRKNDEETKEIYNRRYQELSCYLYEEEELTVILPQKSSDLIYEGRDNHNCVGSLYVSRYEKGRSNIFFIREKKAPGKSYITVELNQTCDKTVQAFYSHNRKITKKRDLLFIENWLKHNRQFS